MRILLGPHPKPPHSLGAGFLEGCPPLGGPRWPPPGGEGRTEQTQVLSNPVLREDASRPTIYACFAFSHHGHSAWHPAAAEFRASRSLTSYPNLRHPFTRRYLLSSYSGPGTVPSAGEAGASKGQKSWPPELTISQGETATTKLRV